MLREFAWNVTINKAREIRRASFNICFIAITLHLLLSRPILAELGLFVILFVKTSGIIKE